MMQGRCRAFQQSGGQMVELGEYHYGCHSKQTKIQAICQAGYSKLENILKDLKIAD
jgi:hypothetical protein